MTRLVHRDPHAVEWPVWLSRRLEDWWPERMHDAFGQGSVKVEEFRDGDTLVVRAELPGIDPDENVEISIHDGLLHISGERSEHADETKKDFYRSEFTYGMFERTIPLPAGTTDADIKATYKDGVLEVRIPMKADAVATTKVPVIRLP